MFTRNESVLKELVSATDKLHDMRATLAEKNIAAQTAVELFIRIQYVQSTLNMLHHSIKNIL